MFPYKETRNQLTGFYMMGTLTVNGLITMASQVAEMSETKSSASKFISSPEHKTEIFPHHIYLCYKKAG